MNSHSETGKTGNVFRIHDLCILFSVIIWLCTGNALASVFNDGGLLRLVNREEKITKNFVPEGLIQPQVPVNKSYQKDNIYMVPEAAQALERMFQAAKEEMGYTLLAVSGYRSFGSQSVLFDNKVAAVGSREKAWRTVAPPGASEHQLGLAMDVVCDSFRNLNNGFSKTPEGQWLYENCQRFGYILRYKAEWADITGYAAEPWHFRYVGIAHACAVQWLNIPYETYAHAAMQLPEYALEKGNACLLYGLVSDLLYGDGQYVEELWNCGCETDLQQLQTMFEMTECFLPEGVTVEQAMENEVTDSAVFAR